MHRDENISCEMSVFVGPDGLLRFVYSDELLPLMGLGDARIGRASHVEPTELGWSADLSPVSGPHLGPFERRDVAIRSEVAWLENALAEGGLLTQIGGSHGELDRMHAERCQVQ